MKTHLILLASLATATAQFTTPSRTSAQVETPAPAGEQITPAPAAPSPSGGPAGGPEQTFSNERFGRLRDRLGRERLDRLERDRLDRLERERDRLDRLDRIRERIEREREERDRDRLDRARERLEREREARERLDRERPGRERPGGERPDGERPDRERPGRERPGDDEFIISPPPGADVTITTAINPTRAGSGPEAAATALDHGESGGINHGESGSSRKNETSGKDAQGGASRHGPGVYVTTLGLAIGVVAFLV
ncbi:beta ketoadipyl CoA thiolase, th1 [Epichloe bromicola]|uniref:Beta ketoadipyl CoA thiolase, th1 n=1 Tax=Epichloe bromicola TaxID=79588 RepID=A0ABQ0CUK4_9HYPO